MMRHFQIIVCLLLVLTGVSGRSAVTGSYVGIIEKNIFRLRTPEIVIINDLASSKSMDVKLTGISVIEGQKQAWLMIPAKIPKEKPRYLSLKEGEEDGSLKISKISEQTGEVELLNFGVKLTLSLKSRASEAPAQLATPAENPDAVPPRKFSPINAGGSEPQTPF